MEFGVWVERNGLVASVAIGALLRGISLFLDGHEDWVHDWRLGFLRLRGVLRMKVVYISLLLRFMYCTPVSRGFAT